MNWRERAVAGSAIGFAVGVGLELTFGSGGVEGALQVGALVGSGVGASAAGLPSLAEVVKRNRERKREKGR